MRVKTWTLGTVVGLVGLLGGRGDARAADYYTGWISEEAPNNYTYCSGWDEGFNGFSTTGQFSDNLRFICSHYPTGMYGDSTTDRFTEWFSEEDQGGIIQQEGQGFGSSHLLNERYCNSHIPNTIDSFGPAVVAGWACSGQYCDNQSLECVVPKHSSNGSWGSFTSCFWTTYSEETGNGFWYSGGRFITGVRCTGRYCDNMQFYICIVS